MTVRETSFTRSGQPFATSEGLRSWPGRTIDKSKCTPDEFGGIVFEKAPWLGESDNNFVRVLPRSKLTAPTLTSSPAVSVEDATPFVAGDSLYLIVPSGSATFALVWANGDTATVTVGGVPMTYAVTNFTTLDALAAAAAAFFQSHPLKPPGVTITANGPSVLISGQSAVTLAASEVTAGTGTFTASGANLAAATLVGTITDVIASTTQNLITLSSNAAVALPAGSAVGTPSTPLGIISDGIDLAIEHENEGIFYSGTLYRNRLGYLDAALEFMFPMLKFLEGLD
ncbi:MAG: hypothetical protein HC857_00555 [Synechococcales cyanobacterium RU_4_20]|nr:hypothetical protein [Synechococcales cyanobacterium RU_4_20]